MNADIHFAVGVARTMPSIPLEVTLYDRCGDVVSRLEVLHVIVETHAAPAWPDAQCGRNVIMHPNIFRDRTSLVRVFVYTLCS